MERKTAPSQFVLMPAMRIKGQSIKIFFPSMKFSYSKEDKNKNKNKAPITNITEVVFVVKLSPSILILKRQNPSGVQTGLPSKDWGSKIFIPSRGKSVHSVLNSDID